MATLTSGKRPFPLLQKNPDRSALHATWFPPKKVLAMKVFLSAWSIPMDSAPVCFENVEEPVMKLSNTKGSTTP